MSSACPHCGGDHPAASCPDLDAAWDSPTAAVVAASSGELAPGLVVGDYQLVQRLDEGGMGVVWSGIHPLIGRKVAIKIMRPGGPDAAARFLTEAQAASRIRHRNIVDVFSFGQLPDGRPYLVMEFLDGESLAAFLKRSGALPFDLALPILDGILAGLRASHEKGIIHRDLKPENVWLCPPDDESGHPVVKLLDFGLAKLIDQPDGKNSIMTRAGTPLGTPSYMSPEQCRGVEDVDARSDLYSLGVIMFQMFAARVPFAGDSHIDVINQHLSAAPPSLARAVGAPPSLELVVLRALGKRPEDRFQSAADLRDALHRANATGWIPREGGAVPGDLTPPAYHFEDPRDATRGTSRPSMAPALVYGSPLTDAILLGDLTIRPELDGTTLTLYFHGELDADESVPLLARYFDDLTQALRADVSRVVLDLEGLAFLSSAGLTCLAAWLLALRDLRESGDLAPATIRYTQTVRWQVATTSALHRADPALMLESAD